MDRGLMVVHANPVLVIQFSISPQLPRVIVLCFGARHIITLTVHLVTHVHNIWSSLYLLLYLRNLKLHRCPPVNLDARFPSRVDWGPFLESSRNFSGPLSHCKIVHIRSQSCFIKIIFLI